MNLTIFQVTSEDVGTYLLKIKSKTFPGKELNISFEIVSLDPDSTSPIEGSTFSMLVSIAIAISLLLVVTGVFNCLHRYKSTNMPTSRGW